MSRLGVYRPGNSVLHRLPAGVKLLGLLVFAVVVLLVHGPWWALGLLATSALAVAISRMGWATVLGALRGFALVGLSLGAYHMWQNGWSHAVSAVAGVFALILAATVLTATTASDDLLDSIIRILLPFTRFGVNTERIALAFALVLRSVPATVDLAVETAQAARARGLDRDPRARLIPFVLRSVARARATGDALAARGIGDD